MDNFSLHLSTKKDSRVGDWAAANNVELAYVPTNPLYLMPTDTSTGSSATSRRCGTSRSTAPTTATTTSRTR